MPIAAFLEAERLLLMEHAAYRLQSALKTKWFLKKHYSCKKTMCGKMKYIYYIMELSLPLIFLAWHFLRKGLPSSTYIIALKTRY